MGVEFTTFPESRFMQTISVPLAPFIPARIRPEDLLSDGLVQEKINPTRTKERKIVFFIFY